MTRPSRQHRVTGAPEVRAVLAGGAWKRGRDCLWPVFLQLLTFAVAPLACAEGATERLIEVPSGMPVSLQEVLAESPQPATLFRFRFVAPELVGEAHDFEDLTADMEYLCQDFALPKLAEISETPGQIVVSLSAEPTEFGVATPDVRQVFEAYSIQDGICIWEAF